MAGSDFIDISLAEVANTASSIRATNQRLKTNLGDIKTQMNSLSQSWSSPAADNIVARFNSLDTVFQNYYDIIDKYALFLDQAVEAYDTTGTTINTGASQFE